MTAELLALSDAEVNERLAVAMGWKQGPRCITNLFPWTSPDGLWSKEPPNYCTDLNLMATVEAEIARRGDDAMRAYAEAFLRIHKPGTPSSPSWYWLTAPASVRARAALAVLGGTDAQ